MASRQESVAAAASGDADPPLPPEARALLRWLPTAAPSGAFAGQHDQVHCPGPGTEVHARVSLWWSDAVVHPGDRVGPPRGGLVPHTDASYNVALPSGGYLWVQEGRLGGWRARKVKDLPLVRADGQHFEPGRYSSVHPYFRRHYERMSASAVRAALAGGSGSLESTEIGRVLATIAQAQDPVVCGCTGREPTSPSAPLSLVVPETLLVDTAALRVLVGEADAVESAATLWRLSDLIWDPVRVGRAMAAEAASRNSGEPSRGWPQAPITEQAVAHIAAQAVRYHGVTVVPAMPAWLLGWVMVAQPVLESAQPHPPTVAAALDCADRVRVARVETQWHAMAAARLLLSRTHAELTRLDSVEDVQRAIAAATAPDAGHGKRPDASEERVGGMPLHEAVRLAYACDVRSWFGVIAGRG